MGTSTIEWTDLTWNPATGCDRVSAGCDHCYALTQARRLKAMGQPKYQHDGDPRTSGPGFGVSVHADALTQPLRWTRPQRVFVTSMGDLFHDQVPDSFVAAVFAVMAMTPQHTYQLLTKRHARMRSLLGSVDFRHQVADVGRAQLIGCQQDWLAVGALLGGQPLPNVWLGVSAEDQATANLRIPALLETPAAVRFVSAEPLLGPIELTALQRRPGGPLIDALAGDVRDHDGTVYAAAPGCLDWVIAGGESGTGARPMHPDWARALRDQTVDAGRAFLFKQWGAWATSARSADAWWDREPDLYVHRVTGRTGTEDQALAEGGPWHGVYRAGAKAAAGRVLDGRTWDEFPR